ncbi:MAG: ATP-binding protein [Dissulfurimicrobium sp.]|uniref:ATP-binding protein n=1 Tax=Dissulfurimicrobium sp. TaxID=2022436 RepID=UPI004049B622
MDHLKTPPVWAEIRITEPGDVAIARQLAAQAAKRLFYSKARSKDAMLVASELAQNHIEHHTRNGLIRINGLILNDAPRLTIASLDEGPGIQDLEEAMKDGFSTSGGLGIGLGTVRRLSDSFHICSTKLGASPCPDIGTNTSFDTVAVSTLLDHGGIHAPPLDKQPDISALIRPYPGETYSGDTFYCRDDGRFCLMALIDATGHGRSAAETAQRSIEAIAGLPPGADPDKVLDAVDKALFGSDGASVHVLVLDRSLLKIKTAGVGNVNCILYLDGERRWPPLQPGVVGNSRLTHKGFDIYEFGSDVLCFMYSDGIKPIPDIPSDVALKSIAADIWAQFFFNPKPSMEDDASLVTWKWRITKA